jgi:hypothetical protein
LINGSSSVAGAAAELGRYDYVVLGDLLEKTSHPDHASTVAILAHPAMTNTTVFGYINLAVTVENLPLSEIQVRVDEWQASGANGIFFDLFGYDFETARARQNAAVDYAHSKGMPVVANAFIPDDAFGSQVNAYNPSGKPTSLNGADFYLYESHQIILGQYDAEGSWRTKANALEAFQKSLGFKILSVTTSDVGTPYDPNMFFYAWYSAVLYGHEATGWGEFDYSALSSSAPFRTRPSVDPGIVFSSPVVAASPVFTRTTNLGTVLVNTAAHAAGFTPFPLSDFIPGGRAPNDCTLEWITRPVPPAARNGLPANGLVCTDDDPTCDFGVAGDQTCTFHVAVCFNVAEARFACAPTDVAQVQIYKPTASQRHATDITNRAAIEAALVDLGATVQGFCSSGGPQHGQACRTSSDCDRVPGSGDGLCRSVAVFRPALSASDQCTGLASITVPLRNTTAGLRAGKARLRLKATPTNAPVTGARPRSDSDTLAFVCNRHS